jgi:hypothetical protein
MLLDVSPAHLDHRVPPAPASASRPVASTARLSRPTALAACLCHRPRLGEEAALRWLLLHCPHIPPAATTTPMVTTISCMGGRVMKTTGCLDDDGPRERPVTAEARGWVRVRSTGCRSSTRQSGELDLSDRGAGQWRNGSSIETSCIASMLISP